MSLQSLVSYFDFGPDNYCRSRQECRVHVRKHIHPCDLHRSMSLPRHSQSHSALTGKQKATPLSSWCWCDLNLRQKNACIWLEFSVLYYTVLYCRVLSLTCECAGGSHGPAGAAVLWDVLVACDAHIVFAINVAPVPGGGEIGDVYIFMRPRVCPKTCMNYYYYYYYYRTSIISVQ